jgi:hypothetical protein
MRQKLTWQAAVRILGSKKFLWFVLLLFSLQAVWVALTGRYPQAFDEQTHFGITRLYANQWWPFFAHQPPHAGLYGDVVRNPSFLFYFLLSFPYRLIRLFTDNQMLQIIMLRFINIGLAAAGLVVFRKVLLEMRLSRAKSNLALFLVTLLPFAVLLAAQISYDNLQFLLAGVSFLWAVRLYKDYQHSGKLDWFRLVGLIIIGLYACSVKYTFLPLLAGFGAAFLPGMWRTRRTAFRSFRRGFVSISLAARLGFVAALVIAVFLFAGGVGLNLVRYHAPEPRCDLIIGRTECAQYGPWYRDHAPGVVRTHPPASGLLTYPFVWLQYMVRESFFAISSAFDSANVVQYFVEPAIVQLWVLGWFWTVFCIIALLGTWRYLWREGLTRMVLVASLFYVAALFFVNLRDYRRVGYPVAIHGRYLLPVLIPLLACVVIGLSRWLHARQLGSSRRIKLGLAGLAAATVLLFTQGGGMMTYIVRSNPSWFWPQSQPAQRANQDLKSAIDPFILFN